MFLYNCKRKVIFKYINKIFKVKNMGLIQLNHDKTLLKDCRIK